MLMRTSGKNRGFTLIEMLMVVAIIIILVSIVVGLAKRISDQSKIRLCRDTLALIGNSLEQFRDFGYEYKNTYYAGLDFPVDCNDDSITPGNVLETTLQGELGATVTITGGTHDPNFSGSEGLYFFLSQIPDCRATIDRIDKSLITSRDDAKNEMKLVINPPSGPSYPLMRFIDPWGTTLHYDYYDETSYPPDPKTKKTFPVITSAGPDKKFGTNDDISNIQQ